MKKNLIFVLILAVSVCSMAFAFAGHSRKGVDRQSKHRLLSQLPEEKRELFRETMKEAKEEVSHIREQIRELDKEIKDVLTADEFDQTLYSEKTNILHELNGEVHESMDEAVVTLAKQFTAEEREILTKLISHKPRRHGHPRDRRDR